MSIYHCQVDPGIEHQLHTASIWISPKLKVPRYAFMRPMAMDRKVEHARNHITAERHRLRLRILFRDRVCRLWRVLCLLEMLVCVLCSERGRNRRTAVASFSNNSVTSTNHILLAMSLSNIRTRLLTTQCGVFRIVVIKTLWWTFVSVACDTNWQLERDSI